MGLPLRRKAHFFFPHTTEVRAMSDREPWERDGYDSQAKGQEAEDEEYRNFHSSDNDDDEED